MNWNRFITVVRYNNDACDERKIVQLLIHVYNPFILLLLLLLIRNQFESNKTKNVVEEINAKTESRKKQPGTHIQFC